MSEDEFVRLAEFDSEVTLMIAKTVLEEEDIETQVSGLQPSALGFSLEGADVIDLLVRKKNYDKAVQLLAELEEESEQDPIPEWTCKCGEQVDEGFFICWSCGEAFEGKV